MSFIDTVDLLKRKLDIIQAEIPEETDNYHRLFLYFVGQLNGISPERISICDAKGDQCIDFYDTTDEAFVAYQCKLPEFKRIEERGAVRSYGPDVVNEVEDILTFLTDDNGNGDGNTASLEARDRYRSLKVLAKENKQNYKLEVGLACFGKLTQAAKGKLETLRNSWSRNSEEFEIKLIDYSSIEAELNLSIIGKARPQRIELRYRIGTSVQTNEWGYTLVPAIEFYKLFDKFQMALFDLNVRYYLERSSVNKQIINSLTTSPRSEEISSEEQRCDNLLFNLPIL